MSEKTVSPAITATKYMVQWEEHPSHLASRLGQLLEQQTLVDVTLMCNTHTLRVHRAVLAACSPYFETILQRQLGVHPLIVLKDMQFNVLKSLIEFMYCGETSVTEENLGPLLQAAKFFQVKGLSSMTKEALGLPATPAKTTTAPTSTTTPTQPRTVSKTTPRTTTTTTVRNATPLVRTPETGTATTTTVSGQQQRKTLLTTGQQQASATAAALARGKRVVTQQTPVRPGQGSTTVYGQPRRAVQQTPTSSAISSTSDSGQPWRATSASPKETQQHDTAQLLLSLGNEYPQQKASPGQAVANKTSLMNKGRVVTKAETPNGGLKTQTATTTGSSLNKIVMKPQQTASSSLAARKRVQQTPRSGQSNMLMNKQAETKTITSSISNQVNQSRSQPATYAHQKRKTPPQQTTVTQTQQNQQQQLVAVASEEDKSGTEQTSVVYQLEGGDLAGNVVYQLDESLLAASDANIVYQLPDGTTVSPSELQGNMLYQVAADEPQAQPSQTDQAQVQSDSSTSTTGQPSQQYLDLLKAAGIPTDMPVLLDNGNGEYVAVNEEMLKSMVNGGMLQISDSNGEPMQLVVQEEQSTETNTETPTTSADDNKPEAGQSMPSLDLENNQQQHEQTVTTTSASALSAQSMPTLEESNTNNEGLSVEQALEAMMGVGSEPENKTEEIIETTTTTTTNTLETTESVLNKEETETVETKETRVEGNNEMDVIDQLIQESAPTQEETTIQAEPQDDSQENIKEILEQTSATDTSNANTIKNENSTTNKRKLSTENNTECESEAKRVKEAEENFQEEEKLEEKTEEKITDSSEVDKEKPTEVIESDIKE